MLKFLSIALLVSSASTVQGIVQGEAFNKMLHRALEDVGPNPNGHSNTAAILELRWRMDEPTIAYNTDTDVFTLDFVSSSPENQPGTGMRHKFFDERCMYAGEADRLDTDFYEVPLFANGGGISNPAGTADPALTNLGNNGRPQLQFKIDHATLAGDTNVFTMPGSSTP